MLRAFNALSEPGFVPPEEWLNEARLARDNFLSRSCVGYIIVDKRRATAALRDFATDALRLVLVHDYPLLMPQDRPACVAASDSRPAE